MGGWGLKCAHIIKTTKGLCQHLQIGRSIRRQALILRHRIAACPFVCGLIAPRVEIIVGTRLRPISEVLALTQRHISDQNRHLTVPHFLDYGMVPAATHCASRVALNRHTSVDSLANLGLVLSPPQVKLVDVSVHGVASEIRATPTLRLGRASYTQRLAMQ